MTIRSYSSPEAFKQALEQRLPVWATPYAAMAREDRLVWTTLDEVTKAAKAFLDPVLAENVDAVWNPESWTWG